MFSDRAIHVPPTAITLRSRSQSAIDCSEIPPVGMNRTPRCANGAATASSDAGPPAVPAGKYFATRTPARTAALSSLAS